MRIGSSSQDKSELKSKKENSKLASSQYRSVRRRNQDTQRNTAVTTHTSPSSPTLRPTRNSKSSSIKKNMLPLALRSNISSVVTTVMSELSSASASSSSSSSSPQPSSVTTGMAAALYVLSGVMQPLLVTLADMDGLADKSCQLYMMFYYLGPASVSLSFCPPCNADRRDDGDGQPKPRPKMSTLVKAASIALIDIVAQSLNYTGSILAGPTIFAIIYSSVTVWTALFSRCLLGRRMNAAQWAGVLVVFGGLTLAAVHATSVGQGVFVGSCLVIVGSAMHASTYVLSEMVMTTGCELSVRANCALQGMVALCSYLVWQLVYTIPRWDEKIGEPMREAGTTVAAAVVVLTSIALANLLHAVTFFHTLRHFPSGATSAGVMKGLQAVLVFAATSVAFCGEAGTGTEMCFNGAKLVSLCVVLVGVMLYGRATEVQRRSCREGKGGAGSGGYGRINDVDDLQI